MQYINYYESPFGRILLSSDGAALTGLWFEGQKYFARGLEESSEEKSLEIFEMTNQWLNRYFAGEEPDLLVPVHFTGTGFQKEIWEILLTIPYGQTITYGEIAKKLALKRGLSSMSSQAVGGAVGHNPISIIVPCHRVVGANGSLTGYAGGIEKKIALLELEKVNISGYFIPKKSTAP